MRIEILGRRYEIECRNEELDSLLRTLVAGFTAWKSGTPDRTFSISEDLRAEGIENDNPGRDPERLAADLEHALLQDALRESSFIPIHAAVIGIHDRTTLLIGSSGAGKTTLTLGLVEQGCSFFSDEAAPVDPSSGHVMPFHRCPAASAETMQLLGRAPESTVHARINGVYCIDPTAFAAVAAAPSPIDDVVFVSRSKRTLLEPVDGSTGMTRLIALSTGVSRKTAFETAGRITERARYWTLGNGDYRDTIETLMEKL